MYAFISLLSNHKRTACGLLQISLFVYANIWWNNKKNSASGQESDRHEKTAEWGTSYDRQY